MKEENTKPKKELDLDELMTQDVVDTNERIVRQSKRSGFLSFLKDLEKKKD
ncbi:MAG: hypothetical protein HN454_04570 [Gammaproteobacteria bacterium]|jgi:hypothetical protein|nr:hypothetical protein [Gammaproteobacteria bacterium]